MKKEFEFGRHGIVDAKKALEIMIEKQLGIKHYIRGIMEESNLSDKDLPQYISLLQEADKNIINCISEIKRTTSHAVVIQNQHADTVEAHELAETLKSLIESEVERL